jgi:hypothetical protein
VCNKRKVDIMELTTKTGQSIRIREYTVDDFLDIHRLNIEEKWTNLVEKETDTKQAWNNSFRRGKC